MFTLQWLNQKELYALDCFYREPATLPICAAQLDYYASNFYGMQQYHIQR